MKTNTNTRKKPQIVQSSSAVSHFVDSWLFERTLRAEDGRCVHLRVPECSRSQISFDLEFMDCGSQGQTTPCRTIIPPYQHPTGPLMSMFEL